MADRFSAYKMADGKMYVTRNVNRPAAENYIFDPKDVYLVQILGNPRNPEEVSMHIARMDLDILAPEDVYLNPAMTIVRHDKLNAKSPILQQIDSVDQQLNAQKAGLVLPGAQSPGAAQRIREFPGEFKRR